MLRLSPLFICVLLTIASCNNNPGNESTANNEPANDTAALAPVAKDSSDFDYNAALEPLTVGAKFAKLLHDTLGVKMYEFTVKPGDSVALHKHPDHIVYVLQGGTAEFSFNGAPPHKMELKTGMGFVAAQVSDAGKNIGKTTIKLVVADIYRPRK